MTGFADLARLHTEATPGPWQMEPEKEGWHARERLFASDFPDGFDDTVADVLDRSDGLLIAAARNAIPEFLRIREETLALHRCVSPIHNMRSQKCKFRSEVSLAWQEPCRVCEGEDWDKCAECRAPYPCLTVRIWNGESE